MHKKLSASPLTECVTSSNGRLPVFDEEASLPRPTGRRLRKQAGERGCRAFHARTVAVVLATAVALVLFQLTPLGVLQFVSLETLPGQAVGCDRRWSLRNLSSQPHAWGAAMVAGAGAVLQQLGAAYGASGLAAKRGTHIIVAATTNADETRWIDERLGNLTASRTYVVVPDAAKRKRCQDLLAGNATAAADTGCWPHLATGGGKEASVYLQYIVDEWDQLPESILFIHGHEQAWHRTSPETFFDIVRRMRWGEVAFGSLRTWGMLGHNFWDLAIMISPTEPERCREEMRNAPEWWDRCREQGERMRRFWEPLGLNNTFGLMPFEVHAPGCCAEFVVRRDRIRARPRSFYIDLLDNLNKYPGDGEPGFLMEHSWHAIFGEPWVTLGIGKCQLIHCSDEEMQNPHYWPPPVNHPYSYVRGPDADRVPHP